MPIKIPRSLPAKEILEGENIFVMDEDRAVTQDIRPLKICILNLMPTKIVTKTQLLRLLSNTPLQVDITLLNTVSHRSKNTAAEHLETFYKTFADVRNDKYDGLIVTGAPGRAPRLHRRGLLGRAVRDYGVGQDPRLFLAVRLLGRVCRPVLQPRHR